MIGRASSFVAYTKLHAGLHEKRNGFAHLTPITHVTPEFHRGHLQRKKSLCHGGHLLSKKCLKLLGSPCKPCNGVNLVRTYRNHSISCLHESYTDYTWERFTGNRGDL